MANTLPLIRHRVDLTPGYSPIPEGYTVRRVVNLVSNTGAVARFTEVAKEGQAPGKQPYGNLVVIAPVAEKSIPEGVSQRHAMDAFSLASFCRMVGLRATEDPKVERAIDRALKAAPAPQTTLPF